MQWLLTLLPARNSPWETLIYLAAYNPLTLPSVFRSVTEPLEVAQNWNSCYRRDFDISNGIKRTTKDCDKCWLLYMHFNKEQILQNSENRTKKGLGQVSLIP